MGYANINIFLVLFNYFNEEIFMILCDTHCHCPPIPPIVGTVLTSVWLLTFSFIASALSCNRLHMRRSTVEKVGKGGRERGSGAKRYRIWMRHSRGLSPAESADRQIPHTCRTATQTETLLEAVSQRRLRLIKLDKRLRYENE